VGVLLAIGFGQTAISRCDQTVLNDPERHFGLDLLDRKARVVLPDDEALGLV
jgi:hypothetical protein